jgi:hypothetical protein
MLAECVELSGGAARETAAEKPRALQSRHAICEERERIYGVGSEPFPGVGRGGDALDADRKQSGVLDLRNI